VGLRKLKEFHFEPGPNGNGLGIFSLIIEAFFMIVVLPLLI